eukprot:6459700-Amphidinium_carterae.1
MDVSWCAGVAVLFHVALVLCGLTDTSIFKISTFTPVNSMMLDAQVRGQWMNAASCVVAFCSAVPEKQQDVEEFLHLFVRLMSLLFCTGLQQVPWCNTNSAWRIFCRLKAFGRRACRE